MPNSFKAIASALLAAIALGTAAAAQQPRVENGPVAVQNAGSLGQTFRSLVAAETGPTWVGYSVPVANRERIMCCFNSGTTIPVGIPWYTEGRRTRQAAPYTGTRITSARLQRNQLRGDGQLAVPTIFDANCMRTQKNRE